MFGSLIQEVNTMSKATGQRIKTARKAKHWTQLNLAESTDLDLRTIQRAEDGDAGKASLRKIAAALELDVSVFVDTEPTTQEEPPQKEADPFMEVCDEMMRRLYLSWLKEPRRGERASLVFQGMEPAPNLHTHLQYLTGERWAIILSTGPTLRMTLRGVLEAERRGIAPKEESAQHLEQRTRFLLLLTDQYDGGRHRSYAGIMKEIGMTQQQYDGCFDVLSERGLLSDGIMNPRLSHRGYQEGRALRAKNMQQNKQTSQ
jgi:transcriptional regulator with XRE-family HTH domain